MREAYMHNNWSFVPIFLKIYTASMRWTPWSFLGWGVMMSTHDRGTHPEWVEGRGWRLSPKFFRMRVYLIHLKHISTGEHSLHISWRSTHPYIYISYFQDDVMKWKYVPPYWPFVRGIHQSLVNSPTKASDAELWCFLWSAPNQTVE